MTQNTLGQDPLIQKLRENILDLFFPFYCSGCGKIGAPICQKCLRGIVKSDIQRYIYFTPNSAIAGLFAVGSYENIALKESVHKLKYENIFSIAPSLAKLLYREIKKKEVEFDYIAFIPITEKRKQSRGYNQSELIARELSRLSKTPLLTGLLKVKETKPQVGLTKKKREKNLKGAFRYKGGGLTGKTVLLCDDVYTTGTTMSECAQILKKGGATKVYAGVIAKE